MSEEKKDIKIKEKKADEKVKFSLKIEVLDHTEIIPYETTRRGLEEFKRLMNPFKEEIKIERAEAMENLTFLDGVILVREIFDRIINGFFDEDDKDTYGSRYDYFFFRGL